MSQDERLFNILLFLIAINYLNIMVGTLIDDLNNNNNNNKIHHIHSITAIPIAFDV
jgi:hypothetical protein